MNNFIESDFRCNAVREEDIKNKVCLDIGCNEGLVGINLAAAYGSSKMLGLDVDEKLIRKAEENLALRKRKEADKAKERGHDDDGTYAKVAKALDGCTFMSGNFRFKSPIVHKKGEYDTIICLSVMKWIHLNYGDKGVEFVLKWFNLVLKVGGLLILEFQNMQSYKNAKGKKELREHFGEGKKLIEPTTLKINPENFPQMLMDKYSFEHERQAEKSDTDRTFTGRNVYFFRKQQDIKE